MPMEPAPTPVLTRTERAMLRALFASGGECEDGHGALAQAVDCGERSLQRAAQRLSQLGFLTIKRRGRGRTAKLTLSTHGKSAAAAIGARAEVAPPKSQRTTTAPSGFVGDANALNLARITARISHDDSPIGLARAYVSQIEGTPELVRITAFLDEHSTLPTSANPTGLPILDEGLRAYFDGLAKRARTRDYLRTLARGVKIAGGDD